MKEESDPGPASGGYGIDLLELYKLPGINQISGFYAVINQLNGSELAAAYGALSDSAPRRHARNLRYFVGHTGEPSSGSYSNRREEHLAIALWNESRETGPMMVPVTSALELLDYQFPLKARRSDKGVGKVDLFGVLDSTKPCVIELKVHSIKPGMGDTPLRAFLEALAYCAIVEANAGDIAGEAFDLFGHEFSQSRPVLMLMAPEEYWTGWFGHRKTGPWWPSLCRLADSLMDSLGLETHFLALRNRGFRMGLEGRKPQVRGECSLIDVAHLMA